MTISPSTVSGVVSQETILLPNTILTLVSGSYVSNTGAVTSLSTLTEPASIIPGTTLPASTVSAIVTVVTTTQVGAIQSSTTPSATTKKGGAGRNKRSGMGLIVVLLAGLVML